jgi:hypothetical protein
MDIQESRMIGALLLLMGVSFLVAGIYTRQVDVLVDMLKTAFRTVLI